MNKVKRCIFLSRCPSTLQVTSRTGWTESTSVVTRQAGPLSPCLISCLDSLHESAHTYSLFPHIPVLHHLYRFPSCSSVHVSVWENVPFFFVPSFNWAQLLWLQLLLFLLSYLFYFLSYIHWYCLKMLCTYFVFGFGFVTFFIDFFKS